MANVFICNECADECGPCVEVSVPRPNQCRHNSLGPCKWRAIYPYRDEEKIGERPTTYPDGVPIFPDDTPCPKCGYHTVILHSHGDIALECPKCDWFKTVNECIAEKVGTAMFETFQFLGHDHYRCKTCGETFCGNDVEYFYHECEKGRADRDG